MGVLPRAPGHASRADSQLYVGDGRKPVQGGPPVHAAGQGLRRGAAGVAGRHLCAVAKVDELHFDAVLHDAAEDDHIHLTPLDFPVPVHGLAIEPKRHGDEQRMWEILQQAGRARTPA